MEIKWHVLVDFDEKNALCKCVSLFEFLTRNGVVGFICIVRWVYHRWNPEIRLCCNISSFRFCFDAMGKTDDQLLLNNMNHVHWRENTIKMTKTMFPSHLIWFLSHLFGMFMPSETLSVEPTTEWLPLRCDHIRWCGRKSFVIWKTPKCGQASVHGCAFNSWFWLKRLWAMKQSA